MSSNDSNEVIYYTNVHYNSTINPIDSAYSTFLNSDLLSNQNNYLVAVNKFKISDLSSIPLSNSNIPFESWQIALQVNGTVKYGYVPQVNSNNSPSGFFYYNYDKLNRAVKVYRVISGTPSLESTIPLPLTVIGEILFVTIDTDNNFWIATPAILYVVSSIGVLINSLAFVNIVYISMSRIGECVVSDNIANEVSLCVLVNGAISVKNVLGSLSTLNSACYDNTAGFYVEGNNSITFINADFTIGDIVSFAFTNPLACEILSDSNMGYVLDYDFIDYPPLIVCENANGDISSPNQINLFDLNNSNRNFLTYFSATSIYPFYFGNSVNFNIMGIVTGSNGTNYTGGNINDITTSTAWNGIGYSPQPYPFSCAMSSVNPSLIIGSSYNGSIVRWVPSISGWQYLMNSSSIAYFPDSPSIVQVSFDPLGHCWVCVLNSSSQYKIYKSSNIPAYTPIPNASNNPLYDGDSSISSNIPIACITFDLNNLNIVYGVQAVGGTGYLYKGFYNPVNRSIEWVTYRTDNEYCNYVLLSAYYTPTIPGVDNTKIYPINLLTHTVGAGVVVTGDVVKALSRDSTTQALYLGSIANNQIVQYSSNLTVVSNFGISNVLNVYTHDADAFDAGDVNIYDLQTYLTQINQCFLDVYSKFSGYTLTIPSLTLDPTTGRLTMIYDTTFEHVGNFGIYLNNSLLNYLSFSTQSTDVSQMNKLLLSYSGSSLQMKKSIFKLNQLDKIVLETSLNIVGDLTGNLDKSLTVFTEFDIDTSNPDLLQNDGDLLYAAVLLRNYVLNTTSALRSMNYSFYYQYKSGYKQKFFINSGENVSIKLQFTKKY